MEHQKKPFKVKSTQNKIEKIEILVRLSSYIDLYCSTNTKLILSNFLEKYLK